MTTWKLLLIQLSTKEVQSSVTGLCFCFNQAFRFVLCCVRLTMNKEDDLKTQRSQTVNPSELSFFVVEESVLRCHLGLVEQILQFS